MRIFFPKYYLLFDHHCEIISESWFKIALSFDVPVGCCTGCETSERELIIWLNFPRKLHDIKEIRACVIGARTPDSSMLSDGE